MIDLMNRIGADDLMSLQTLRHRKLAEDLSKMRVEIEQLAMFEKMVDALDLAVAHLWDAVLTSDSEAVHKAKHLDMARTLDRLVEDARALRTKS